MTQIKIIKAKWAHDKAALSEIRSQVFIKEQHVPQSLEWDGLDEQADHWLGLVDGSPVACARLIDQYKIGRMAVLKPYRHIGIGSQLIKNIIHSNDPGKKYSLSAQCHAFSFYYRNGFSAESLPYEDAGIPHIDMTTTNPESADYCLNRDTKIHHGSSLIQTQGFLDLMLCQINRSIIFCLKDLSHPILKHENLTTTIKQLIKRNRRFKVYILLSQYSTPDNEHPLFRLQDRLPSFIEIKKTEESLPNQIVLDSSAWFDFDGLNSRACFHDTPKIKHFMERYNQWWHNAKPILDARRLSI